MAPKSGTLTIEDYALIGDCETAALIGKNGSIDWLCWPDFSSPACFAALLGTEKNGRWLLAPADRIRRVTRRYRPHTLILETTFETATGVLLLTDFMPVRGTHPDIVRIVKCLEGKVAVQMELCIRYDFGRTVPWAGPLHDNHWAATAGATASYLRTTQKIYTKDQTAIAHFTLKQGEQQSFVLTHARAQECAPRRINVQRALRDTEEYWHTWCATNTYDGSWKDAVERSLITLKALTYRPTGGIVAAPTTSLPETLGSDRNWDYRFCWLRDAAFTLEALLSVGYRDEAHAWQQWLLQSVGSDTRAMQIMYGIYGERHLAEVDLPWLRGYHNSQPVRLGNAASEQVQLDVYGEVADVIVNMKTAGIRQDPRILHLQRDLTDHVASICNLPGSGLWEERNRERHFTYSKAMAWLALDLGIRHVRGKKPRRWTIMRNRLHREICQHGFNSRLGSFVQTFDSATLDASVLLLPIYNFLPFTDARVKSTMDVVQKKLGRDGFIYRFLPQKRQKPEGTFVACSFWMVQNLAGAGRHREAEQLFKKLIDCRNDVGLMAEEYDPGTGKFLGNFPQALSHIALINAARMLERLPALRISHAAHLHC